MTLREMRQNAGYSRTKAGAKMNVCESTLAHWELGDWLDTDLDSFFDSLMKEE